MFEMWAQDSIPVAKDSTLIKQKYGLRIGFDLARPLIQTLQKEDIGFEITADMRVTQDWYVAMELGYESEPNTEDYITYHTKGSYGRLGFNYNTYENWHGLSNELYVGLRYGYAQFDQELISYTPLDLEDYFGSTPQEPHVVYSGLNAHWGELVAGLKVEVISNLYLTTGIQFKKLFNDKKPEGFDNLYIPGFNKVYLNNGGVWFNYTIAYMIPLYKK
jgi:hypothetical protein